MQPQEEEEYVHPRLVRYIQEMQVQFAVLLGEAQEQEMHMKEMAFLMMSTLYWASAKRTYYGKKLFRRAAVNSIVLIGRGSLLTNCFTPKQLYHNT